VYKKTGGARAKLIKVLKIDDLPVLPRICMEVLEVLQDEEFKYDDVADLICQDMGLAAHVLKAVNTAIFGGNKTGNIHEAVRRLGTKWIESIVLGGAVLQALPPKKTHGFHPGRFQYASARRAATADALSALLHPRLRPISFTGGLLQDMAIPLLAKHIEEYRGVLETWHRHGGCLRELEREHFSWDHAFVGYWLAIEWRFPKNLAEVIRDHEFLATNHRLIPPAVSLVAHMGEQPDNKLDIESLATMAWRRFAVDMDNARDAIRVGIERSAEVAAVFH